MLSNVATEASYADPGLGVRVLRWIGIGLLLLVPLVVALAWRPIPSLVTMVAIGNGLSGILLAVAIIVTKADLGADLVQLAVAVAAVLVVLSFSQWRARPKDASLP